MQSQHPTSALSAGLGRKEPVPLAGVPVSLYPGGPSYSRCLGRCFGPFCDPGCYITPGCQVPSWCCRIGCRASALGLLRAQVQSGRKPCHCLVRVSWVPRSRGPNYPLCLGRCCGFLTCNSGHIRAPGSRAASECFGTGCKASTQGLLRAQVQTRKVYCFEILLKCPFFTTLIKTSLKLLFPWWHLNLPHIIEWQLVGFFK